MSLGFKAALIAIALAVLGALWAADRKGQYELGKADGRTEQQAAVIKTFERVRERSLKDKAELEKLRNSLRRAANEREATKRTELSTDTLYRVWREQEVPPAAVRSIWGK